MVVPVFNEEGSVGELARRLVAVLETMGTTWEVIFVDDGSRDRTVEILRQANLQEPRVKLVRFRRNFGQTAALAAGFDFAAGEIVVTMDGDLQNDPADIPRLVAKIGEGFDLVNGWRVKRQDTFLTRRLPSMIANSLISFITGVKLHDYGCTLKAFRHEVAKHVSLYGELHRFIPAIASGMGVEVAEIPVNHHPRTTGKSKYGLFRTVKVLLDLITVKFLLSYSTRPIHIFGLIGLVSAAFGVVIGGWLSYQRLFQGVPLANRPILFLAVLLVIVGVQFVTMGLLAELQTRIYHESKKRPTYMVRETPRLCDDQVPGDQGHARHPPRGDAALAARRAVVPRGVRPLRLQRDPPADLRGDHAVRARPRGLERHRREGDVHVPRQGRQLPDAAPGGDRRGRSRLSRGQPRRRGGAVKLWYAGPMFRYERPQKGRFRQFHQIGAELFGVAGPEADAELLQMVHATIAALGVPGLSLQINSLGDAECRPAFRQALIEYFRPLAPQLCENCRRRLETNPLRILDCKAEGCRALRAGAPDSREFLCDPCREHFAAVCGLLDAAAVPYVVNPGDGPRAGLLHPHDLRADLDRPGRPGHGGRGRALRPARRGVRRRGDSGARLRARGRAAAAAAARGRGGRGAAPGLPGGARGCGAPRDLALARRTAPARGGRRVGLRGAQPQEPAAARGPPAGASRGDRRGERDSRPARFSCGT